MLVLLKEGGIYADIDVKLNANLETFITPNLGFFVPRDLVGGYANHNFCLWNGLIGAAPGHPFLLAAVERMLTLVLNRGDYHDMEREACRRRKTVGAPSTTEIWKLRTLDLLLLTGPCALGVSVHSALQESNLVTNFPFGWLRRNSSSTNSKSDLEDLGDVLLLEVSWFCFRWLVALFLGLTTVLSSPIVHTCLTFLGVS